MKQICSSPSMYKDPLSEKLEIYNFNLLQFNHVIRANDNIYNEIPTSFKAVTIIKGKCIVKYHGVEYYLSKGDVFLISPYTMYSTSFIENETCEGYQIYFDVFPSKKIAQFIQLFECFGISVYSKILPDDAIKMIGLSYENTNMKNPGSNYSAKLVLMHLLLNLLRNSMKKSVSEKSSIEYSAREITIVRACIEYIDEHISENVKVQDLCNHLSISQAYLFKCFKKIFNLSVKEFLMMYRFRKLETDLVQTNRPIQEISDLYGYPSVYAFSSAFKKRYGVSPYVFRKNSQTEMSFIQSEK